MIINHWGSRFASLYNFCWPESYLTLDTEWTGHNPDKDLIVEIGHTLVRDRTAVDRLSLVLDWSDHPVVPERWVRESLRRMAAKMAAAGKTWRFTWEVMTEEGVKPEQVLSFYLKLFTSVKEQGLCFVAHNGYTADIQMLQSHFAGFLGKKFDFGVNQFIDTGGIEKATQALESNDPKIRENRSAWLPQPNDTLESYFRRITGRPAKGIFWNLPGCVQKYQLAERHALDTSQAHTAGYDSFVVHLLMEEFRRLITISHKEENPWENATTLARAFDMEMAKARTEKERMEDPPEPSRAAHGAAPVRRRGQRKV